ncbi:MAG: hypothetical protein ABIS01_09735, partial [Ferruginibacter sp.]
EHFYNPKEFYGDVIMPSCSRDDKSFDNQYWRGSEWPPLNFLVYLGLRNYNKPAPKELAEKSYELFISAWTMDQCVYETLLSLGSFNGYYAIYGGREILKFISSPVSRMHTTGIFHRCNFTERKRICITKKREVYQIQNNWIR